MDECAFQSTTYAKPTSARMSGHTFSSKHNFTKVRVMVRAAVCSELVSGVNSLLNRELAGNHSSLQEFVLYLDIGQQNTHWCLHGRSRADA